MAFRKDNKIKSNFSKISIGLASPEEMQPLTIGRISRNATVCSASVSSVLLRIMSAIAVSTNVSVTKALCATVAVWK